MICYKKSLRKFWHKQKMTNTLISSQFDTSCSLLQHSRWISPSIVWRVQLDVTPCKRLEPRTLEFDIEDLDNLRRQHDSWNRDFISPFLSTFSDKQHAINWGRKRCADGIGILYTIDTTKLKNKMYEGLQPHEFLIVGKIRSAYILKTKRLADIPRHSRQEPRSPPTVFMPEGEGHFATEADMQESIDITSWMEYDH